MSHDGGTVFLGGMTRGRVRCESCGEFSIEKSGGLAASRKTCPNCGNVQLA